MINEINSSEEEDNHISGMFGSLSYSPEQPVKKTFLPWHRPRKQFVRDKQWSEQILKLVEDFVPDNSVLKYLGLPGDDLLDLRHFHDVICAPKNLKLKFLGFNRGANSGAAHRTDLEVSLDEVNKLPFIDSTSNVIGDDFCHIAHSNSVAQERSMRMGPYDVINIDLCDGFAQNSQNDPNGNHFDALQQLMALQARRSNPWLLLVTTRTGSDCIDGDRFEMLKGLYEKNLIECAEFLATSNDLFEIMDRATLEACCATESGISNVFLTSLCKWIISVALNQNPPAKVELKSVIGYKIKDTADHPDLISLAIKIIPTFIVSRDQTGLGGQAHEGIDEGIMATKVLNRVSKQVDADAVLSDNNLLMENMISASVSLLEKARYDVSNYSQWINTPI